MNKSLNVHIIVVFISVLMMSCNSSNKRPLTHLVDSASKELSIESVAVNDESLIVDDDIESTTIYDLNILIPRSYRVYEGEDDTDILNSSWMEIYKKDGAVIVSPAEYVIRNGYDECSGDSLSIIESDRNTILFFNNLKIKPAKLDQAVYQDSILSPSKSIHLTFRNSDYILRSNGDGQDFNVKNYELILSAKGINQYLIKGVNLNDTQVQLLFAGDIDQDGELDLILSAPRDYEEDRYLLFLSSKATGNKLIKLSGECVVQFDC